MRYNDRKWREGDNYHSPGLISREVGGTGVRASMMHRKMQDWIELGLAALPDRQWAMDEVCNRGVPKRLNLAFMPDCQQVISVIGRLQSREQL
ncbi:MAG TPA: hypothetical protein VGG13_01220 [Candidatus Saccharimonadales bacterium]|jgi:hypothetical protein